MHPMKQYHKYSLSNEDPVRTLMFRGYRSYRGFTLIEVIVTLLLVGITASLGGMWLAGVASGYATAKLNADIAQKAQLATTRLTKEFNAIRSVSASSGTSITFNRIADINNPAGVSVTVSRSGDQLLIDGSPLTDRVSGFTLRYCTSPNVSPCPDQTWSSSSRIIEFQLTLAGANNTTVTLTRRVAPRNL